MIRHRLLHDEDILIVSPEAPLEANDFEMLNKEVTINKSAKSQLLLTTIFSLF
ncbi:MAG: hypothetical protein OQK97_07665 [Deltaproteobacteria bacterium]|jgi:hypothetical protein|nr:hypothetical protein [Deltaproteobacteria bacterium]MEE4255393.1 hypothetical protein [Desulfuromusa sp.]